MKEPKDTFVLVVEDETSIGTVIKKRVERAGFQVDWVTDGELGLQKMRSRLYDIVLLDMNLPKVSGFEFLTIVRGEKFDLPIVIISADRLLEHRIKALRLGADDYLVKPFDFEELLARIEANLRRMSFASAQALRVGEIVIDLKDRRILLAEKNVEVSDIEFRLMELLARNANKPLSRALIAKQIWGHENYKESNVIDVYLGYLSKALEVAGKKGLIRETPEKEYILRVQ